MRPYPRPAWMRPPAPASSSPTTTPTCATTFAGCWRHATRVEAVADGAEALRRIEADPPDLVLSDVMMPRLDGFDLLRAIRARPRLASLPVILLSARAGEESRVEGLGQGADDYLVKPFSARELVARVSAHTAAVASPAPRR